MKKRFTFVLFSILILISCTDADQKDHYGNSFTLSYDINEPVSLGRRGGMLLDNELKVNSFYILFFEYSIDRSGQFLDVIDVSELYNSSLNSADSLEIIYPKGSVLNNYTTYNLLLCANIKEYTQTRDVEQLKNLCKGKIEAEIAAWTLQITGVEPGLMPEEEQSDNSLRMPANNLPMAATMVKLANQKYVEVHLNRIVERFDVSCMAKGYELESASIWNACRFSYLWSNNFEGSPQSYTERYYGTRTNDQGNIQGALYAFENFIKSPTQNDKVTTCLIIGLKNQETGKTEYFRTNINASSSHGQKLQSNMIYHTIVMHVRGAGNSTEREAYENSELLLDVILDR